MKNEQETYELVALDKRLSDERYMIGWLCTVHRNAVRVPDNPEATRLIQEQLNRANGFLSLVYVWALLDEAGFDEHNKWISSADRKELKAWKHVRHTGAHAPGSRAHRYKDDFDDFMTSGTGMSGLRQNCTYTETSIELKDGMNYQFFQYVKNLIQTAIGRCAIDNVPD